MESKGSSVQVEEWIKASWVVGLSWRAKCKQHQKLYLWKTDHEKRNFESIDCGTSWNLKESGIIVHLMVNKQQF